VARPIRIGLFADEAGLRNGLDRAKRDLRAFGDAADRVGRGLRSGFGTALKAGAAVGVGGLVALGAVAVQAAKDIGRVQQIEAQTAAVIKSTGGAAKVTAQQVADLAGGIEALTSVEGESIQEGANLLLTFTNIKNEAGAGNDIFDQTTRIMTDMAVALGTDASASAIQLGKALNDPIAGVSALSRVGVSFTEQQKKQIEALVESGNVMGAQKIILAELNKEFGGSAEALGETLPGKIAKLQNAFGGIAEEIVGNLIPVGERLVTWAGEALPRAFEALKEWWDRNGKTVLDNLKVAWEGVRLAFADIIAFVTPLVSGLSGVSDKAGGVAITAEGVRRVLVVLAAAFGAMGVAAVLSWVQTAAAAAFGAAQTIFHAGAAVFNIGRVVAAWVVMGAQALAQAARVAAAWLIALGPIGLVIAAVVGVVAVIALNWDRVKSLTIALWETVSARFAEGRDRVVGFVRGLVDTVTGAVTGAWDRVKAATVALWTTVTARFSEARDRVVGLVRGLVDSVKSLWDRVTGIFKGPLLAVRGAVNAFIGGVNSIAGKLGLSVSIPLIPSFHQGGVVGSERTFRDLSRTPLRRDEQVAVLQTGETVLPRGAQVFDALESGPGMGDGLGILDRVKSALGTVVEAARAALVSLVRPAVERAIASVRGLGGGSFGAVVSGAVATLGRQLLDWLAGLQKELDARAAPSFAGGPGQYRDMFAALQRVFPFVRLISGLRPGAVTLSGNQSYHALGRAVDVSPSMEVFDWIARNYAATELIFTPAGGRQELGGRPHIFSPAVAAQHNDHIHWAMDDGGVLPPGPSLVVNRTGRPEPLARADELGPRLDQVVRLLAELVDVTRRGGGVDASRAAAFAARFA